MPDDEQNPDEDKFRPEAIAVRVERLGDETAADRLAHEEEQKLVARRKDAKSGLETAASKRLQRIGEGKVKRPGSASAATQLDPMLERTARATDWIKRNLGLSVGLVGGLVVAAALAMGYSWWQERRNADASVLLAQGFADDHGHVSAPSNGADDKSDVEDSKLRPLYPTFKSVAARRDAALAKYREVESKYSGTGASILARLAEGSLLLDSGNADGAKAAFQDVKASPLAKADAEVRGRALEGLGFGDELLAQADKDRTPKLLSDALSVYKELEAVDANGFKELAQYHQARVFTALGDKPKAIEILKALHAKVTEPARAHAFSYLQFVVEDRLRELDPSALPPKPAKAPKFGGGGGDGRPDGPDMNDPKIQELLKQLKAQQQQRSGGTPNGAPK